MQLSVARCAIREACSADYANRQGSVFMVVVVVAVAFAVAARIVGVGVGVGVGSVLGVWRC